MPGHPRECGMIRAASDSEVDLRVADAVCWRSDAEADIGKVDRQTHDLGLGRTIPDTGLDVVVRIGLER